MVVGSEGEVSRCKAAAMLSVGKYDSTWCCYAHLHRCAQHSCVECDVLMAHHYNKLQILATMATNSPL